MTQPPLAHAAPSKSGSSLRQAFKVVALFVLVSGGLVWAAAVVAAVEVAREGLMRVTVHEKRAGGDHVSLYFPAAVVNLGFYLAPSVMPADVYGGATEDLARFKPLVAGLAREIDRCPDGTLIEVRDRNETVVIALRNGALEIHVDDPSEEVHVVLPISVMKAAAHLLPDPAPAASVI